MNILAIIPARGGSKGIHKKNLVEVEGKSLVTHSIEHAQQSKQINRVLVSTDDPKIAEVSKEAGAEVPFLRPSEISGDEVLDHPVFEHALKFLDETDGYKPDLVVHLRPTAPIRKPAWIDEAIQLLIDEPRADSVRSVSQPPMHPYRMFDIDGDGFLEPIMSHRQEKPYQLRRQDLPPIYYYNCVIDVTRPQTILDQQSMTGDNILPYIMDPDQVFDIDSPRDLEIIRILAKKYI